MATRSGKGRTSSRLAKENRSRVTERAAKGSLLTGCEQERRQGAPRPRQEKRRRGAGEHGNSPVYCHCAPLATATAAWQHKPPTRRARSTRRARHTSTSVKGLWVPRCAGCTETRYMSGFLSISAFRGGATSVRRRRQRL